MEVHTRPTSLHPGEVFRFAWRLLCDTLGPVAALSLIGIPIAWCGELLQPHAPDLLTYFFDLILQMGVGLLYGSLATAFFLLIGSGRVAGETLPLNQLLKKTFSVWPRVLWTQVVVAFTICVGSIALILPGIYLALRLVVADSVTVFEGPSGPGAFKRSFEMTESREGKLWVLGLIYLGMLLGYAALWVVLGSAVPDLNTWPLNAVAHFCGGFLTSYFCFYTLGIYEALRAGEGHDSHGIPMTPEA